MSSKTKFGHKEINLYTLIKQYPNLGTCSYIGHHTFMEGHGDTIWHHLESYVDFRARDHMQAQESFPLVFCTHKFKSKDADWTTDDMSRHCADNWLIPRSDTPVHESEKEPCSDTQSSAPFWLLMWSSRFSCVSNSLP